MRGGGPGLFDSPSLIELLSATSRTTLPSVAANTLEPAKGATASRHSIGACLTVSAEDADGRRSGNSKHAVAKHTTVKMAAATT
jgi:septal ring-binding cell division protein DamX